MRAFIVVLLLLSSGMLQTATAQVSLVNVYCQECRNTAVYPEDARNFAVNQLFGSTSWLSFDQADRFRITDSFGNVVTADINAKLVMALSDIQEIELPEILPLPDTIILQIRLIYENGDVLWFAFDIRDLDPDSTLPVPADAIDATPEVDDGTLTTSTANGSSSPGVAGSVFEYIDPNYYWDRWQYGFQLLTQNSCRAYYPAHSPDVGVICPNPD